MPPQADGLPHPPHPTKLELDADPFEGQLEHCFTELPNAAQKAFPKGSSAQAKQFDGSPVQLGEFGRVERKDCTGYTGKIGGGGAWSGARRRGSGIGGAYAGRLSRIDEPLFMDIGAVAGAI